MTLSFRRRAINAIMLTLTGVCTVFVAGSLLVILGYLAWNGATSLSLNFFTRLPAPIGEAGGGMANAIIGSGKVLLIAMSIGVPIGFFAGVYLSEFGEGMFSGLVR